MYTKRAAYLAYNVWNVNNINMCTSVTISECTSVITLCAKCLDIVYNFLSVRNNISLHFVNDNVVRVTPSYTKISLIMIF